MDLLFDNCSVFCELIWTLAEDDYSFSEFHPGKQTLPTWIFNSPSRYLLKPTVKLKSIVPVRCVVSCCICVTIYLSFAWEIELFSSFCRPAASSDTHRTFKSPQISFCWRVVSVNIDSAKADTSTPRGDYPKRHKWFSDIGMTRYRYFVA